MTEQELIQENEKLKVRLNKAIEIFKEQKENIVQLTEERDKALLYLSANVEKLKKLEEKLAEKSSNDDKFFEQEEEISRLNDEIDRINNEKNELAKTNEDLNKNLSKKAIKVTGLTNELEILNADYAILEEKIKSSDEKINDQLGAIENLKAEKADHIERITNLSVALDKAHETLDEERKNNKVKLDNIEKLLKSTLSALRDNC